MNLQKVLHAYVEEMYPMEKGVFIAEPGYVLRVGDCRISRRQIKHIVEQRKAEHKSLEEVAEIVCLIPEVIFGFDFEMPNYSQKYPESIIRAKIFAEREQGVVIVMDKKQAMRDLITAHLYSPSKM